MKNPKTKFFDFKNEFTFESGESIPELRIAYQTYGQLNSEKNNVILLCHALTGNSHAAGSLIEIERSENDAPDYLNKYSELYLHKKGWWDDLIGKNRPLDTNRFFIICPNIIGSCYGSTGPASKIPGSEKAYKFDFPVVTVRDIVRSHKLLLDYLGIERIHLALGGSLGGMQVLEWSIMYPDYVEKIAPIAASARHSSWAIGFNEIMRKSIINDKNFNNGNYEYGKVEGLSIARMVGMLSYRSELSFDMKFSRKRERLNEYFNLNNKFQIQNYLNYQGDKLVKRFDPISYIYLSYVMDLHDISMGRGDIKSVLGEIKAKTLCVGISTDILYPNYEQKAICAMIPGAFYAEVDSIHGHDAFLIEFERMSDILKSFLD